MTCQTPTSYGQLNAFQKVMLQWSSLHPYNAAHVYKMAGPLRSSDLADAVETTFRRHGLGIAHLSADGQSFRHETETRPEVEVVSCGEDPGSTMEEYLSRALNRPFGRPTSHPFRFAAIDAGPQSHYVILAYDHWVADARSAGLILQTVLGQYLLSVIPEQQECLKVYRGTCREAFRRHLWGGESALAAFCDTRPWNRNRPAWHVDCSPNRQWAVDYRLYHTIPGTVARLREFARANGATVHDVLLAAFGRALAEIMPSRGRRYGLALSGIVDTGSIADEDRRHAMGTVLDYHRGVSTGPRTPIVLLPTTFREHLNVGVSYRIAEFPRAKIDAVMEMFRDQIEQPVAVTKAV